MIIVPSRAPRPVLGVSQVVSLGSFDVAVAKQDVRVEAMAVGWAGGMPCRGLNVRRFRVAIEVGRF